MPKSKGRRNKSEFATDVHVGARIREIRLKRELTQGGLASALGITFQQLQKYERGTNRVSCSKLWRMCAVLECTPADVFDGLQYDTARGIDDIDPDAIKVSRLLSKMGPTRRSQAMGVLGALAGG